LGPHFATVACRPKESDELADNRAVNGPVFRFRLERVRAVRERRELEARQELAQAISRRAGTEDDLRVADEQLERAQVGHRTLAVGANSTRDSTELLASQAFLERMESQRGIHAEELRRRKEEVADRDARLATAAGEHEMLKRLKERQRGEHDRQEATREQGALDEIAASRFGRSVA
jgi:flagellar export protein FliJ